MKAVPTGPKAERAYKRLKKSTGQDHPELKKEKNKARAVRRKQKKKNAQAT